MNNEKIKKYIEDWVEQNAEQFVSAAMDIFDHPELGMEEHYSSKRLADLLESNGFQVEMGVAGMPTAFLAVYGSGKPVIAVSAEYDALPGLSQKRVAHHDPVKEGGPGHGCGHHLLGTGGVCAAAALRQAMEHFGLPGTIKVYGTPAEEICVGKPFMARAGIFDDADAILDWHPSAYNRISTFSNAYFSVYYHFKGKTSHGNSPWFGRSALDAGMLTGHALEMLREHVIPGLEGAENTYNYTFSDVGPAIPNVVPDRATLWCIGRFSDSQVMADFMERVDKCAEGCAIATGTTVERELISAIHEKFPNNDTLNKVLYDNWTQIGPLSYSGEEQSFADEVAKYGGMEPSSIPCEIPPYGPYRTGVSDNSEYYWFAPTVMAHVAILPDMSMIHNWMAAAQFGTGAGKRALPYVGKLLAFTGADLLTKPELLAEAKKEHEERMKGRTYRTLLGDIDPPISINRKVMEE